MNDHDALDALTDTQRAIIEATERRLARAREGFDTTAIRSNSIPKKSRKTSIFHRALR